MTLSFWWVWCGAALVLTWGLTAVVRRYAITRQLVDVPNERTSHVTATPRGGGLAIVIATGVAFAWWGDAALPAGVLVGAVLVAAVGFIDDHGHVSPVARLVAHSGAASLAVWSLHLGGGMVGAAAAVFFVVWMTNLTNFMDGIDGIASVQTILVCVGGAVLLQMAGAATLMWLAPAVLASATLGFLAWNWPPARIFMGDVGSGYLGFMVAVLTLQAGTVSIELGWGWAILSSVFLTDATVTLVVRALRGERLFEAHRSHAYQHLALRWRHHRPVTVMTAAINVGWLSPLAFAAGLGMVEGPVAATLALVPLVAGAIWLGAGRKAGENPC